MHKPSALQSFWLTAARIGVLGLLVSMPISRALFNVSAALMLLGWIFSGDFSTRLQRIRGNPSAMAAILLFGVVAAGGLYSVAEPHLMVSNIVVFSKLLYIPVIWTLLASAPWVRRAHLAYAMGMLITLLTVYADVWLDIPGTRTYLNNLGDDHGVFYHHIAQSIAMSFFAVYALHRGWTAATLRPRLAWLLVCVLAVFCVTHLSASRTGHLCLLAGFGVAMMVYLPKRQLRFALPLALLLVAGLILSSTTLQNRFTKGYNEIVHFQFKNDYTSMGARLQMWNISAQLIREKPLIGHGTGSYPQLAQARFNDAQMCQIGCAQPHNQFMFSGVENGALGIAAVLLFMLAPIYGALRKQMGDIRLIGPLMTILLVAACFDSALLIRPQEYFFVTVLALLVSTSYRPAPYEPTYGSR